MADIYINPTGDDGTGDGSSGNPYATISKAHTVASDGDTIYCQDGTYTWATQGFTKNLTVEAVNTKAAIFDAGGASVRWLSQTASITLTFTGIWFNNSQSSVNVFYLGSGDGKTMNFNSCVFSNLQCNADRDAIGGGIFAMRGDSSMTLTSCIGYGWSTDNSDDVYAAYIACRAHTYSFTMINCSLYLDATGTNQLPYIFEGVTTLTLTNTIIQNAGDSIGFERGVGSENTTYTDVYGTGLSARNGTGNISSDPQFMDGANGDLRLRQGSPCIDQGTII